MFLCIIHITHSQARTQRIVIIWAHSHLFYRRFFTPFTLCCRCSDSLAMQCLMEVLWLLHGPSLVHTEDKCCGWVRLVMFRSSGKGKAVSLGARGLLGPARSSLAWQKWMSVCCCPVYSTVLAQQPVEKDSTCFCFLLFCELFSVCFISVF